MQIASLDSLVSEVSGEDWKEYTTEYGDAQLDLSADDLHKDNISGGSPYALEITPTRSIDALFLNEPNETTFIDYLRICFEYCGFPGIARPNTQNDYKAFFDKVKPLLKPI